LKKVAFEGATKTVWVYTDTSEQVGDPNQLHVFANQEAAQRWLHEFDPEGVAFEYTDFKAKGRLTRVTSLTQVLNTVAVLLVEFLRQSKPFEAVPRVVGVLASGFHSRGNFALKLDLLLACRNRIVGVL
jgi:hypothetical protein